MAVATADIQASRGVLRQTATFTIRNLPASDIFPGASSVVVLSGSRWSRHFSTVGYRSKNADRHLPGFACRVWIREGPAELERRWMAVSNHRPEPFG